MNVKFALIWFLVGFVLVNALKILHTILSSRKKFNRYSQKDIPVSAYYKQAYFNTLKFQPFYYVIVWLTCSYIYFTTHISNNLFTDALFTGISWWALTAIAEMLIWVLVNHKMNLTWKEMYLQSQPWISLTYYSVLVSPLVLSLILH